jgi:hypothetical protein
LNAARREIVRQQEAERPVMSTLMLMPMRCVMRVMRRGCACARRGMRRMVHWGRMRRRVVRRRMMDGGVVRWRVVLGGVVPSLRPTAPRGRVRFRVCGGVVDDRSRTVCLVLCMPCFLSVPFLACHEVSLSF